MKFPVVLFMLCINILVLSNFNCLRFPSSVVLRKIRCQICSKIRTYQKYARHLEMHLRKGELLQSELKLILFQTRFSRIDIKKKVHSSQMGKICSLCDSHVLDLPSHLL